MRDFPFFTTVYGVSSISLREIPYKGQAFIWVRTVQEGMLSAHLQECISLCRMAGAEQILAGNHPDLERFPVYTKLLEMRGTVNRNPERVAFVRPVTEKTAGEWRGLYNQKLRKVDCAATLEFREEAKLPNSGACFVERDQKLLGIGWLEEDTIRAVASLVPGGGEWIVQSMAAQVPDRSLKLEVASTNEKAIRLYQSLGFRTARCLAEWREIPQASW